MSKPDKPDLRPEYDLDRLKGGVRGKYRKSFESGMTVVIEPDLAEAFPSSKSVNDALRELLARRRQEGL